ncbi:MAG: hypothetical protein A2X12_03135 [Bacteroidetes bacterium GWE2_29_8]|nr:MAG: hypothetical protein A2X12_03135 [Bacteroidetes bacterium GWE2_29_8]OFY22380.1 MAG: hypothetical protein A2X02_01895 [Bacteroidetes bacterium GWF2_29_10]
MNNITELYSADDAKIMQIAEQARLIGQSRIDEIISFAKKSGIKRIGIANCVCMTKETEILKNILKADFDVYSTDCKVGNLPASKIAGDESKKGISCNPAGQAEYLNQQGTELNIVLGLCVGHDMILNKKSDAIVTTLLVKDKKYKHNPYEFFENKL